MNTRQQTLHDEVARDTDWFVAYMYSAELYERAYALRREIKASIERMRCYKEFGIEPLFVSEHINTLWGLYKMSQKQACQNYKVTMNEIIGEVRYAASV